jgi:glutathione synthase/RimK-type ligase-like ATP-grasp enzyme
LRQFVVVERPDRWPLRREGVEVISARDYLMDPAFAPMKRVRVFNCCRRYGYQSSGYYVSLLAEARGHRPMPSVATLEDLRLQTLLRLVGEDLDDMIQRLLRPLKSDRFDLSIYFGRNMAAGYSRLARSLFNQYPAPFLRASFARTDEWQLTGIRPIATSEIPDVHRDFVLERMRDYFRGTQAAPRPAKSYRYDMAILRDPEEVDSPSDEGAIRRFIKAAEEAGMWAQTIGKEDLGRLAEFDALFIRETTAVDHHTFRFARKAEAEGLVVIDDPSSILKCTNKVYQAELFMKHGIAIPKTVVVDESSAARVLDEIGLPCVIKSPDSSFSRGVHKAETVGELLTFLDELLEGSDLAIVQEFLPSSFDWRVGVLGGKALYTCRYHMARKSWKIIVTGPAGHRRYGKVDTVPLDQAPAKAVDLAVRCARLVGDGLYGVDVKEADGRFYVMEINDNPNVDAGYEDEDLGEELYRSIISWFVTRLEERAGGKGVTP